MATLRNPTPFSLFCSSLGRSIAGEEIVDGLTDEQAEIACASGVFERGVLVIPEVEPEEEEEDDKPKRPAGRPSSKRGSVVVEEAVLTDRETR